MNTKIEHKLVKRVRFPEGESGFLCQCGAMEVTVNWNYHQTVIFNPKIINWIKENLLERPKGLRGSIKGFEKVYATSYGLKHNCERSIDKYVSNGEFQAHMLLAGFTITKDTEINSNKKYKGLYIRK